MSVHGLPTWFSPLVCSDSVDSLLRLITEGQPHGEEAPQSIEVRFSRHGEAGTRSHDFILVHGSLQTQEVASGLSWKERSN